MTWMLFYRLSIKGHYFQSDPLGHHGGHMNSRAPPLFEADTQHCDWGPHYSKKQIWQGPHHAEIWPLFLSNIFSLAQLRATFWYIKQCREGHMTWILFFIDSELRATIFKVIHLGTTGATWIQEHHYCWKQLHSIVIGGHIKVKKSLTGTTPC